MSSVDRLDSYIYRQGVVIILFYTVKRDNLKTRYVLVPMSYRSRGSIIYQSSANQLSCYISFIQFSFSLNQLIGCSVCSLISRHLLVNDGYRIRKFFVKLDHGSGYERITTP